MIIVRYERPRDWRVVQTSDPILREMDWLLDDPILFKLVHADLSKHYARSEMGRHSVPIEVLYRLTVLRRRKQWSLRRAQQEVEDSPVYRDWVRLYDQPVPHYSTLNELERAIGPCTVQRMNERLLVLAQAYDLTQGYRLRVDSSVTESNIEHPTDSGLLLDGVQVLSRLLERAQDALPNRAARAELFRNRTRSAKRQTRHIQQLSRGTAARTRPNRRTLSKKMRSNRRMRNWFRSRV
jgi:transposase, IS5 family